MKWVILNEDISRHKLCNQMRGGKNIAVKMWLVWFGLVGVAVF